MGVRFLLLMPEFDEGHLVVDAGIIPRLLVERHGWDVTVASERPVHLPVGMRSVAYGSGRLSSLTWLWRNAPFIEVLCVMHCTWRSMLRAFLFRWRNRRGICWLKLDMAEPNMRQLEAQARQPFWRNVFRTGLEATDIVSVESTEMRDRFRAFIKACHVRREPRLVMLPTCGFDIELVLSRVPGPDMQGNVDLLYVGRLGPWQKAPEVLLEAYRLLREVRGVEASLHLVGRPDARFAAMFSSWRERVGRSTSQGVVLHGPVIDRTALVDLYWRAKVFVIASRYEGVPNVIVEAGSCGCLLVATPVGQVADVLQAGAKGWIIPIDDAERLAEAMADAIAFKDHQPERLARLNSFKRVYSWPKVIDQVVAVVRDLQSERSQRDRAGSLPPKGTSRVVSRLR